MTKSSPTDGTDVEELIKKADAAMCAVKPAGLNQSQEYTDDIQTFRK